MRKYRTDEVQDGKETVDGRLELAAHPSFSPPVSGRIQKTGVYRDLGLCRGSSGQSVL